jgi:hypothetical protein
MENSNLFKLIKSLKKNEKRYVAIFLAKHKKATNILKLYNLINDAETISDDEIARKIKDRKFISQLKINKHNLYYLILDALHNFHLRSSAYPRILNMLHQAEILLAKGLMLARKDILDKADKLADTYELSELKLEIVRLRNIELDEMAVSNNLLKETKKLSDKIMEEGRIKHLSNRVGFYQRKVGQRLSPTQLKYLEKQMLQIINKEGFRGDSFFNQFFYLRILSLYNTMTGKVRDSYENDMSMVELFRANPNMLELHIWKERYLSSLSRLITSSSLVGRNDMLPFLSDEIKRIDISDKRRAFADINILDAYMQMGEYANSIQLVAEVEKNIGFYRKSLGPVNRTALIYNLAVLNFGVGNYSKALIWVNDVINDSDKRSADLGINIIVRILRIIIYYELDYTDLLEYEFRSTYRYIINQKTPYRFDQIVLKFIRKSVALYDRQKIRKALEQTRSELIKLSKVKTEQQTLSYFDFISWLESKIENKKFVDVAKQRAAIRLNHRAA